MTYLAIKNYKKSDSNEMDVFEKLIYSVKYLPQILYFSTLTWLIYTMYYAVYLDESVKIFGFEWSSPFEEISHQTMFFYRKDPWFLPFAAQYYRFLDWIS